MAYAGETYRWSKHHEFMKFLQVPERTGENFELALASLQPSDKDMLDRHRWAVVDGMARSHDVDTYREYIASSRGEFTVAKDQNVRFRSGWFSDRSATYLAAGRPVITQDTAFGDRIPTGRGLFAFSTIEDVVEAVEEIRRDPPLHERGAAEIAETCFSHDIVLGDLLRTLGLPGRGRTALIPMGLDLVPHSRRPLVLPEATQRTLGVIGEPPGIRSTPVDWPATTIIVPTSDNLPILRLCLAAIFANTDQPDWEVLLVDNGSRDGTDLYLAQMQALHDRVRVISSKENLGFAAGVNQGLEAVRGQHVVLLNDDAIVLPGWLGGLLRHLRDPDIGAVGPVTNRISTEAQIATDYRSYSGALKQAAKSRTQGRSEPFEVPVLAMYCFASKMEVMTRVGTLDDGFEIGTFEDDDYSRRLQQSGYRLLCVPDVFIHHFSEASLGKLAPSGDYARLLDRNRQRFEEKWGAHWAPRGPNDAKGYERLVRNVRESVLSTVPQGATFSVISRGDPDLVEMGGLNGRHFPCDASGRWAGYYPLDDAQAVEWLVRETANGSSYLVVPTTSRWWLDYYKQLTDHLARTGVVVHDEVGVALIYRLRGRPTAARVPS